MLCCCSSVTPCVAIDCEFVGTGADGTGNALARVSIVNFHSAVLYDKYVKPVEAVTDYRTSVSGIKPQHVHSKAAISFKQCQREVAALLDGRIVVGHALHNDLSVLLLSHPKHLVRDTAKFKGLCPDRPRSLKNLAAEVLGLDIQRGEHNSVEDARCTLALYKHHRTKWEVRRTHNEQRSRNKQAYSTKSGFIRLQPNAHEFLCALACFPPRFVEGALRQAETRGSWSSCSCGRGQQHTRSRRLCRWLLLVLVLRRRCGFLFGFRLLLFLYLLRSPRSLLQEAQARGSARCSPGGASRPESRAQPATQEDARGAEGRQTVRLSASVTHAGFPRHCAASVLRAFRERAQLR